LQGDKDMVMDKVMVKDKVKVMVTMPFESEEFVNSWELWKDYKHKQLNFKYKTPQSEQAALIDLVVIANNDESTAIKVIHQSMAKGWKGLFTLKNETNATGTNSNSKLSFSQREANALRDLH